MIFFRYIFLLLFFYTFNFSCQLCVLQVPNVNVYAHGYEKDGFKYFDITWKFEKEFSSETLLSYDINGDSMYDKKELEEVKSSLEVYLKKYNFLTFLNRLKDEKKEKLDFEVYKTTMDYEYYELIYAYSIKVDTKFEKDDVFELRFFDEKEFFNFIFKKLTFENRDIKENKKDKHTIEVYLGKVSDSISNKQGEVKEQNEQKGYIAFLSSLLTELKEYITNLLTDIKQNNSINSYIWLLVFSFAYGIIHALGPGHGKSLVGSYFLSNDRSIFKAINISLMIGVVHTFSAFMLTFTIYYILKSVLSEYFTDIETIAIKSSAAVIICIAFYLLYKKFRKPKIKSFKVGESQSFVKLQQNQHINTPSCACSACNTTSTDIGVILAAGIVPCPGTITIFTFTFGLGIYYIGFLSAIFMSLGMSFIIFIAAYLSIKVRGTVSSNLFIKKVLEYGSLLFILSLGIMLLLF